MNSKIKRDASFFLFTTAVLISLSLASVLLLVSTPIAIKSSPFSINEIRVCVYSVMSLYSHRLFTTISVYEIYILVLFCSRQQFIQI